MAKENEELLHNGILLSPLKMKQLNSQVSGCDGTRKKKLFGVTSTRNKARI